MTNCTQLLLTKSKNVEFWKWANTKTSHTAFSGPYLKIAVPPMMTEKACPLCQKKRLNQACGEWSHSSQSLKMPTVLPPVQIRIQPHQKRSLQKDLFYMPSLRSRFELHLLTSCLPHQVRAQGSPQNKVSPLQSGQATSSSSYIFCAYHHCAEPSSTCR